MRGWFEDVTYVALLVIALLAYNVLSSSLTDYRVPLSGRVNIALHSAYAWFLLLIPSILLVSLALQLAPRRGARRWLWAVGVAILSTLWGNRFGVLVFHATPGFDHISEGFATFLLICIGCFLHNTVRHTEAELFRAELDSTALKAEFDRAQLELLRAQIEPHFLFNTLATVQTLAHTDLRTAAVLVDNLLRYLMAALPKLRKEDTSLEDEIELIAAYLRIQQVRMGARLSYDVTIPDVLKGVRVPSVMLLTLVENAIRHGVGPATDGGSVVVSATRESTVLALKVADSGLGMQAQVGYGSGLANIRTRLALIYKGRASFSLEPISPRGVVATIRIPLDCGT